MIKTQRDDTEFKYLAKTSKDLAEKISVAKKSLTTGDTVKFLETVQKGKDLINRASLEVMGWELNKLCDKLKMDGWG